MERKEFPKLATDRLELCEITRSHLDWYFDHFNTQEIVAGQGFPGPEDMETAKEELDKYIVGLFEEGQGFRGGIRLKGEAEIIGSAGFYSWDKESARAQMGYDLKPAYWGRGIMREAVERMIAFGFEEMGLNRIQALIMSSNSRSIGLVQRVGFTREGVLRDYSVFEGKRMDEHMYSLLRREWEASRGMPERDSPRA